MRALALSAIAWLLLCAGHSVARAQDAAPAGEEPTAASVRALFDGGRYRDAEAAARQLLDRLGAAAESLETAEACHLLADALRRAGKASQPETVATASRAVKLRERLLGPDHPDVAESLCVLGLILADRSQNAEARSAYERALAIREKTAGADHPSVAKILSNLAELRSAEGDYAAARQQHERAVAIIEKALGPDHIEIANSLANLATATRHTGDLARSRKLYERALAIEERHLGPEHPEVAATLSNLATVLWDTGEFAAARQALERSLAIRERALGPEHPRLAVTLTNLGVLLATMGDDVAARPLLERALTLREKALGPDHPDLAYTLNALGALLARNEADAPAGRRLLERALHVCESALGPDHPVVAVSLAELAGTLSETQPQEAARLYRRALTIIEKSVGPEHPDVAEILLAIAQVSDSPAFDPRAGALIERALSINERTFGPDNLRVAQARAARASHLAKAGDADGAVAAALGAEEAGRQHVRTTVRVLGERQALLYTALRRSSLDLAVALSAEHGQLTATSRRDVLDSIVRSRALVLDEMAARRHDVAASGDPETQRLGRELAAARDRLAHLVVRGPVTETPEQYRELLEQTRREKEHAEEALAAQSIAFRDQQNLAAVGLPDVEQAMPRQTALVAFVRYAGGQQTIKASAEAGYAAFVLRPGQGPDLVPLGGATEIDAAIAAWRQALEYEVSAPGVAPKRSLKRYVDAATTLRREVWDPVASLVTGSDMVFIVPDGPLHLVNFAALPTEAGRFLIETGPLLHVLSAERDLVARPRDAVGKGLLLMGAPQFTSSPGHAAAHAFRGATANCATFRQLRFSPLPATKREVEAIEVLWRRHSHTRADSSPVLLLEGPDADEAAFKDKAPGREILHLATHGFLLGNACAVPTGNALLCSGLALAGANRRQAATPTAEDGILTAEEIAALDLGGVEWAVLSACETGLGEIATGEGVFGLRRAFQVAGTRSVITSLWPVDDRATRLWMERLYRHRLQDGMSTAAAVRAASLDVLRQRRARGESPHPLYWAGFLAAGDWR